MCWTSAWSPTGSAPLARTNERGRSRVASPAVSSSAGIILDAARYDDQRFDGSFSAEHHVRAGQPELVAMLDEQAAVRVEDEIGRRAPERGRHRENAFLAAFNFHE